MERIHGIDTIKGFTLVFQEKSKIEKFFVLYWVHSGTLGF